MNSRPNGLTLYMMQVESRRIIVEKTRDRYRFLTDYVRDGTIALIRREVIEIADQNEQIHACERHTKKLISREFNPNSRFFCDLKFYPITERGLTDLINVYRKSFKEPREDNSHRSCGYQDHAAMIEETAKERLLELLSIRSFVRQLKRSGVKPLRKPGKRF